MLLRILRADPLLATLTGVLSVAVCLPLFVTPILPLTDLPNHVALASLLGDALDGGGLAGYHYAVKAVPVPYWTLYLLLNVAGGVFGPLLGTKLVVALTLLIVPLGTMRLLVALRRSPRYALLAFGLVWDNNLYWGWASFVLGIGFLLFALAHLLEAETPRAALRKAPWPILVALTHAHAFGIYLVAAATLVLARAPLWRRLLVHAAGVLPGLLALVPWVVSSALQGGGDSSSASGFGFGWDSFDYKRHWFFEFSIGNATNPVGIHAAKAMIALALASPLLLLWQRWRRWIREDKGTLVLFFVAIGLYFWLPMSMEWPVKQWYIYPRQATFVLLAGLLVARPRLERWWSLALVPGVVAALLLAGAVTVQFRSFGERVRPLLAIIDAVRPNRALLPIRGSRRTRDDPALPNIPMDQVHAYVTAVKGGYNPKLFDNPSHPVVHRADRKRPAPSEGKYLSEVHARHYDYLLVQGVEEDPVKEGALGSGHVIRRIREAGNWRLYAVEAPKR